VRASVANFALDVLCVNANRTELEPLVYETWPNAVKMENTSMAVNYWPIQAFPQGTNAINKTALDDLFGWRDEDEDRARSRPGTKHNMLKMAHVSQLRLEPTTSVDVRGRRPRRLTDSPHAPV